MVFVLLYWLAASVIGGLVTAWDKHAARTYRSRVPEHDLLLLAALGGAAGVLLAMYTVHHKTRKKKFTVGVPLMLIIQLISLAVLYYSVCR